MNIYKYILIALLAIASLATQAQTIVYVDAAATGFNNGTSWVNAFKELQPAIDAAALSTPAQVWIKKGTYYPTATTDRNISFIMKNDVEIYGGFKGIETALTDRDWTTHETILSGDIGVLGTDTDNSHNVINNSYLAVSPLTNSAILDGVIVEKGYNQDNSPARIGGAGLRNENASPIIRNCTFRNNQLIISGWGGGMLNTGKSHPFIVGCKFISNSSASWGGAIAYRDQGSGIHNVESVISNSLFYNNHANSVGGAIYVIGYYVNIINNTIANNTSTQTGVGIFYSTFSTITTAAYTNNIIWGNTTTSTATVDIQLRLGTPNKPIVSNSIVEGGYPGGFNADPLFYDASNGDFSIKNCNSPAINVGVNASLPLGIITDLAQSTRIFDTTIDLGAYEYQYLPMSFSAIEVGNVSCNGGANGQISVNVGGGASPFTYNVDGGSFGTNPILTGLAAGSHTVIAKDANGCEITTTESITEPTALTITVTSTNLTCNLNNDGSASVTISGGSTPYKLYLDNVLIQTLAGNTYVQNAHDAGTYTYGILDANGCVVAANPITITQPPVLTAGLTKNNDVSCNGADDGSLSVTATGGTSPYTYSLDGTNFQSSNVFENLGGGTYGAQVRDANYVALTSGCNATTGRWSITIIEPTALSTSVATTDLVCAGAQSGEIVVTASGGTAPLEYSIDGSTFQSSATFSGLDGGSYSVITRDANSCNVTDNVTLTEPAAFSSGVLSANITCHGDGDGSITLSPTGGTSPYEYSIDGINFGSSGSFTSLLAGDYTVTIRDANNCEYTEQITISEPAALTIAASFDGASVSLAATGGTSPYNYSVDGTTFQTSSTFVLGNGQYTFTVKDSNDCEATTTQSLVITALDKFSIEQVSIYPNPVTSELYFQKLGVGDKISIFDQSGRTVYTHKADNLTSQLNVSYLENGVYMLFVTDTKGGISRFKFIKK
ncbi:MAG: T9SS type A sorting domain-containing protein [Cyclobacteriaceae bacterium]|nr:T9SS type A sorting domain-containing protein [Cyclobacteriaceae bacterium]